MATSVVRSSGPGRGLRRSIGVAAWSVLVVAVVAPFIVEGGDIFAAVIFVPFAAVGLMLVFRRPRQLIGWLLVLATVAFVTVGTSVPGGATQVVDRHASIAITIQAWLNNIGSPLFFGAFVTLAVLFPSGRFGSGRAGRVGRIVVAIPALFAIALAFEPDLTVSFLDGSSAIVANPLGLLAGWAGWQMLGVGVYLVLVSCLAAGVLLMLGRFRGASGDERAQYKWLFASLALVLVAVVFAFFALLFIDPTGTWMWFPAVFAYPTIPIAIGVAVLRFRLYQIDRIVSRTVAWGVVTAVLVAVFAVLVIGLQAVLAGIAGSGDTIAVAVSTLVVFVMFQPLRQRIQSAVDRRFDRSRYDRARTVEALAAYMRDEVDQDRMRAELVTVLRQTVAPAQIGVWFLASGQASGPTASSWLDADLKPSRSHAPAPDQPNLSRAAGRLTEDRPAETD